MKIDGNGNVQVGEVIIEKMFSLSCDGRYKDIDLSQFDEEQLEKVKSILFKERSRILFGAFKQRYMKRMYWAFAVFIVALNTSPKWVKEVIESSDNIFSMTWFLLIVGVLFCGFLLFLTWLTNKMKRDNNSIDVLFRENWGKKTLIDKELQRRKDIYWREKCGVKDNIFEYFEKE